MVCVLMVEGISVVVNVMLSLTSVISPPPILSDEGDEWIRGVQEDTACTRLDCCRNMHKSCLHNPCPQRWAPDSVFWASLQSLLAAWLAPHKSGGRRVKS